MPRGKILNKEKKAMIIAYKDAGLSNGEIALKIKRSHYVINNFIKLRDLYSKIHPKGRNKKLTQRQTSLILRAGTKTNVTAGQIKRVIIRFKISGQYKTCTTNFTKEKTL